MPILRSPRSLTLFTHIPKCGGTSVEKYCLQVGLKLAFFDPYFEAPNRPAPWTKSSPQHADGMAMAGLFPPQFFDRYFAVVRHPIERLISAYHHQCYREKTIDPALSLDEFVRSELRKNVATIGYRDNHFLPQVRFFVPQQRYQIFKLENGLSDVKQFIDIVMLGKPTDLPIGREMTSRKPKDLPSTSTMLSAAAMEIVMQAYHDDFKYLGYST